MILGLSMNKKIIFQLHKETKLPKKLIDDAPSSGPFDDYADWILKNYDVIVSLEDSKKHLKSYGAWHGNELNNLEENKARLLWVSILDCKEEKTQYFYMGI